MQDEVSPGGAWVMLLVAGVINLIYSLVYFLWTLIPLLWGGFAALAQVMDVITSDGEVSQIVVTVISLMAPVIQVIVYPFIGFMALITILAAIRLKSLRSKGLVWLGAISAVGGPILGFVVTSMSLCNFMSGGCCFLGFIMGNGGTFPGFIIGLIAAIWVGVTLSNDEIAGAFEANA